MLLAKPAVDTKGDRSIVSRLGVVREVDFTIEPDDDVLDRFQQQRDARDRGARSRRELPAHRRGAVPQRPSRSTTCCASRSWTTSRCSPTASAPTSRRWRSPGSRRLLEIAHSLEELKTICRCGRKAIFNARRIDGRFVFDGDQVAIDGDDVTYESLCGVCYLEESGGVLNGRH